MGRPEIMPNLVGQGQLRNFGRHGAIVVHKRDDPGVQGPLGRVVHPVDVLGVPLVGLADAPRGPGSGSHPGQAQGTPREIPISKNIS